MKTPLAILALAAFSLGSALADEPKKTRDEMVRDDIANLETREDWIYNDLEKAAAEAKAAGKPMMIVFRCIP
ncbi:MAG: hypothetical protein R3F11_15210 [Verrucomicrobiales bacterium]